MATNGEKYVYDFVFNGWGLKFASNFDNGITKRIFFDNAFAEVMCVDMRPFVLEGGSIDTDGAGTLMATSECLCSDNRNEYLTQEEIEGELRRRSAWSVSFGWTAAAFPVTTPTATSTSWRVSAIRRRSPT